MNNTDAMTQTITVSSPLLYQKPGLNAESLQFPFQFQSAMQDMPQNGVLIDVDESLFSLYFVI